MINFDARYHAWGNKYQTLLETRMGMKLTKQELHDAYEYIGIHQIPGTNFYNKQELAGVIHDSSKIRRMANRIREQRTLAKIQKMNMENPSRNARRIAHPVMVSKTISRSPETPVAGHRSPNDRPSDEDLPPESRMDYVSQKNLENDEVYYE